MLANRHDQTGYTGTGGCGAQKSDHQHDRVGRSISQPICQTDGNFGGKHTFPCTSLTVNQKRTSQTAQNVAFDLE